jgi:hypothetical protein
MSSFFRGVQAGVVAMIVFLAVLHQIGYLMNTNQMRSDLALHGFSIEAIAEV